LSLGGSRAKEDSERMFFRVEHMHVNEVVLGIESKEKATRKRVHRWRVVIFFDNREASKDPWTKEV
jgi:hypothetical protein